MPKRSFSYALGPSSSSGRRVRRRATYRPRRRRGGARGYARKLFRSVLKMQDVKVFDNAFAASASTTPALTDCCAISQGDTNLTRDGNRIWIKSISVSFELVRADTTNIFRIMFVQWLPDNGTSGDAVTYGEITTAGSYPLADMYNTQFGSKFRVLYDKTHKISADDTSKVIHFSLRPAVRKLNYNGTATSGTGHVYAILMSDSSAVSHPQVNGYVRVKFTDG